MTIQISPSAGDPSTADLSQEFLLDPISGRGLRHPVRLFAKRAVDLVVSFAVILVFLPVFLSIAVAIFCMSPGSPIFAHRRVGLGGRTFKCLKFRSMVHNAEQVLEDVLAADPEKRREWDENQKLSDDPRVIRGIGEFLRKSSLDELPQFFNILMGQMSLVGPRPVTESELEKYGALAKFYYSVKPGLTGPWQIGGRSSTSYRERVTLDVNYAMHATLRTDLAIFLRTVRAFVTCQLRDGV